MSFVIEEPLNGPAQGLAPEMRQPLEGLAEDYYALYGEPLRLTSGRRSTEEQARLYAEKPNLAAPPGKSKHEKGMAGDLDPEQIDRLEQDGKLEELLRKHGLHRPVLHKGETWHVEPRFVMEDEAGSKAAAGRFVIEEGQPAAAAPSDATSETLAQFAGPAGEMVGQALDLPLKPLRAALEKFHEKFIEPQRAGTEEEFGRFVLEPGAGTAAPEAFAGLPNKDVFVESLTAALAPMVYGKVGQGLSKLGQLAETGMYRYGPDWLFKLEGVQGGVPAIAKELTEAEMARTNPYTRARLMAERIMPESGAGPEPAAAAGAEAKDAPGPWQVRSTLKGQEVNYRNEANAARAAGYLNRHGSKWEARPRETEDGWRVEVRERGRGEFLQPRTIKELRDKYPAEALDLQKAGEGAFVLSRKAAAGTAPEFRGPYREVLSRMDEHLAAQGAGGQETAAQAPRGEGAGLGKGEPSRALQGVAPLADTGIERVPTTEIRTAPEEFQFKLGSEEKSGAGLALRDVKKWDEGLAGVLTLWRAPEGELYVVNGHQRLDLARRTKTPTVNGRVLDSGEWRQEQARAYGALINIAEGRGTPVDMAKFFRDTGLDQAALENQGISLNEAKTRKALALKELSDGLFRETALGRLAEDRAAVIGEELAGNPAAQENLYRTLQGLEAKGKEVSTEQLRELLRLGKNAGVLSGRQESLFGPEELQKSLMLEQAELMSYAKRQLRRAKTVFGTVDREKERLAAAGNVIDPESNRAISREAAEALDLLDQAAYLRGSESNRALNEFSVQLAEAKDKTQVKANFYGNLKKALKADRAELLGTGGEAGGRGGPAGPETGGAVPARPGGSEAGATGAEVPAAALEVPGLDGGPEARAPDVVLSPEGEVKYLHSGGPDMAAMAKSLETRVWETLAEHKIRLPTAFLKERQAQAVPAQFLRQGFKDWLSWGYFPRWVAEKWEAFRPFYLADLAADDVMADHRYEVWGKLRPYFRELSGAERRRVHQVALKLDRVPTAEKRRGIEDEIGARGAEYFQKEHGLSPKEAQAAQGLFEGYRYVRLETLESMKQDVVDLGRKLGLNEARAREFAAEVLEKDLGGDYYPLHYAISKYLGHNYPSGLYDALKRQRENFEFWSRERALYMYPHTRWGPYWLHVFDKEGKLEWAGAQESIGAYKKMAARLRQEFKGQEVEFRESRRERIPMELYNDVNMPGLAAIFEMARDQFTAEDWLRVLETKQAFFAQKGWGAHKIHRSDIPGFETENDKRVISDYFEGWIGMQGKTSRVRGFSEAWEGFRGRSGGDDPGLMKYTQGYVRYLLEHPREASRIRWTLYHLYLGGSMGFRVLHGLHALQTAWPELSTISKQPGRVLIQAIKDRFQLLAFEQGWSKTPGLTGEELAALEQGRRRAALSTDYTAEMAARSGSPLYRWLSEEPQGTAARLKRALDLIYYPTALDRGTREAIFLGSVRELRGKGPITEEVIERAAGVVNNSMYRYARGERPPFGRKQGATWMTFQTWSTKYFQQIFGYVRDSQYGALGRLLAAAGLVGGLNALGVRDAIQAAYRKTYGRDAEKDARGFLQTVLGERGGEALNRILFRGLPAGVAGFDLSPRMVHHLPWNFLLGLKEHPWQAVGAVSGPFEAGPRSLRALSENQPGRAVEALAPTWLRNPMSAYRLASRGPETVSGRPIVGPDFKQHRLSPGEAGLKAAGLQPTRLSEEQAQHETSQRLQAEVQGKLRDWASRFVQARGAQNQQEMQAVLREWQQHNQEMMAARRFADVIRPQQFRAAVQIRQRPVYPEKSRRTTKLREMP